MLPRQVLVQVSGDDLRRNYDGSMLAIIEEPGHLGFGNPLQVLQFGERRRLRVLNQVDEFDCHETSLRRGVIDYLCF